jgi:hypothetical protein
VPVLGSISYAPHWWFRTSEADAKILPDGDTVRNPMLSPAEPGTVLVRVGPNSILVTPSVPTMGGPPKYIDFESGPNERR